MTFQDDLNNGLNIAWKVNNTFLIFLMQLGFALIEAGTIRYKNIHSILLKNLIDVCFGALCWWLIGYCLVYGESKAGVIGFQKEFIAFQGDLNEQQEIYVYTHWVNQWTIASTSTTIVSGSVAERMDINAYLFYCMIILIFIYSPIAHWVWNPDGWLYQLGYKDFAGGSIVHLVGGLCGLIATIMLEPRIGRFNRQKNSKRKNQFEPENVSFIVMGTLFLWFSWFGFNCSSVGDLSTKKNIKKVGIVAMNTTLAASFGGFTGYMYVLAKNCKIKNPKDKLPVSVFNIKTSMGILAGLISITGSCQNITPMSSIIIGIIGFLVYISFSQLLIKFKIDDPIDAAPLHFGCGLWSTLATGFFSNPDGVFYGGSELIGIQVLGILVIILWALVIAYPSLFVMKKKRVLRVNKIQEIQDQDAEKYYQYKKYNIAEIDPNNMNSSNSSNGNSNIHNNNSLYNSNKGNN